MTQHFNSWLLKMTYLLRTVCRP